MLGSKGSPIVWLKPTVGIHVLKSLDKYLCDPVMAGDREEEGRC